jgi:hypothetical protein
MTTYAGGTGSLPVGMIPGERPGRGTAFWVRTVLSAGVGVVAALLLALAGVVGIFALVVVSPEHPGRGFVVALSVPEVRHDAADSLVADMEEQRGSAYEPATRAVLVDASDAALEDDDVLAVLDDVRLDGTRLDPTAYAAALGRELTTQAGRTGEPQQRRALAAFAAELPGHVASSMDGAEAEGDSIDFATGLTRIRRYGLVAAAVLAGVGVVALLVAVAIAVRRGLTAAVVTSAALVVTALALAPGEWLLGLGDGVGGALARAVAAAGRLAGAGVVWSLLLAALVPPAVWWVAGSVRRKDDAPAMDAPGAPQRL